jgi:hypothetical protein
MKLLTKAILKAFKEQGDTSQKSASEIKVIAKFFNPVGAGIWFISEYYEDDKIFFGYANLGDDVCAELGTVSLQELESYRGPLGLGIERDLHFPIGKYTLQEVMDKYGHL